MFLTLVSCGQNYHFTANPDANGASVVSVSLSLPSYVQPGEDISLTGTCQPNGADIELSSPDMSPSPVTATCVSGAYSSTTMVSFSGTGPNGLIPVVDVSLSSPSTGDVASSNDTTILNNPPVATDDAASAAFASPATSDAQSNDSDLDGDLDPSTTAITVDANNSTEGSCVVGASPNYDITFTPVTNFAGTATCTYQICDTAGECDTADFVVTIGAGSLPVAVNDAITSTFGFAGSIDVGTNDSDADSNLDLSSVTLTNTASGVCSLGTSPVINISNTASVGSHTCSYQICDQNIPTPQCTSADIDVTITATPVPKITREDNLEDVDIIADPIFVVEQDGGFTNGDVIKVYSDNTCSTEVGSVTATSSISEINVSLVSSLSSAAASVDYYADVNGGACSSSNGGTATDGTHFARYDYEVPSIARESGLNSTDTDPSPTFTVNMPSGKTFSTGDTLTLHEGSDCSGAAVSASTPGSGTNTTDLTVSSDLTTGLGSLQYFAKIIMEGGVGTICTTVNPLSSDGNAFAEYEYVTSTLTDTYVQGSGDSTGDFDILQTLKDPGGASLTNGTPVTLTIRDTANPSSPYFQGDFVVGDDLTSDSPINTSGSQSWATEISPFITSGVIGDTETIRFQKRSWAENTGVYHHIINSPNTPVELEFEMDLGGGTVISTVLEIKRKFSWDDQACGGGPTTPDYTYPTVRTIGCASYLSSTDLGSSVYCGGPTTAYNATTTLYASEWKLVGEAWTAITPVTALPDSGYIWRDTVIANVLGGSMVAETAGVNCVDRAYTYRRIDEFSTINEEVDAIRLDYDGDIFNGTKTVTNEYLIMEISTFEAF